MFNTNVNTRIVGLFGRPLGHSLSPLMQNTAFEICGLDFVYIPIELEEQNLERAIRNMPVFNFAGANVTIPYKTEALNHTDELDELAKAIGAVNTLVVQKDGRIKGYNTDGTGFLRSLKSEKGINPAKTSFLLIGSGGAARGLAVTLAFDGAEHIYIANRTYEKAKALAQEINAKVRQCAEALPLEDYELKKAAERCTVLINTTSIGMYPDVDKMPVPEALLRPGLLVCDVVYNPIKTQLLLTAEKLGCDVLTGVGMLVNQGAEGFRLWTGKEPPVEAMYEVVAKKLMASVNTGEA